MEWRLGLLRFAWLKVSQPMASCLIFGFRVCLGQSLGLRLKPLSYHVGTWPVTLSRAEKATARAGGHSQGGFQIEIFGLNIRV